MSDTFNKEITWGGKEPKNNDITKQARYFKAVVVPNLNKVNKEEANPYDLFIVGSTVYMLNKNKEFEIVPTASEVISFVDPMLYLHDMDFEQFNDLVHEMDRSNSHYIYRGTVKASKFESLLANNKDIYVETTTGIPYVYFNDIWYNVDQLIHYCEVFDREQSD